MEYITAEEKYKGKKFVSLRDAELPENPDNGTYRGIACVDLEGDRRIEASLVFEPHEETPTGVQFAIYRPTLNEDEISCFGFRLSADAAFGMLACLEEVLSTDFVVEAAMGFDPKSY